MWLVRRRRVSPNHQAPSRYWTRFFVAAAPQRRHLPSSRFHLPPVLSPHGKTTEHLIRLPYEPVFGYSRAVKVGNQIFVAGTVAWGDDGKVTGEGDMYAQARQAIRNIEALAQAGASLADVVRTRTFVTDMSRFDEVQKAHGEAFGDIRPAATVVEVKALVDAVMLVEIRNRRGG